MKDLQSGSDIVDAFAASMDTIRALPSGKGSIKLNRLAFTEWDTRDPDTFDFTLTFRAHLPGHKTKDDAQRLMKYLHEWFNEPKKSPTPKYPAY